MKSLTNRTAINKNPLTTEHKYLVCIAIYITLVVREMVPLSPQL